MSQRLRARAARALRKPPHVVARRLAQEARAELERLAAPRRADRLTEEALLRKLGAADVSSLWSRLAARPYVCRGLRSTPDLDPLDATETAQLLAAADDAVERRVDLLGSGPTALGRPIDWLRDFKSGRRWEPGYARRIEYANLGEPSDVKVPWELSRMQWLIPAAQAYALTQDERYATTARAVIEEWLDANPYAYTVNWSCTMDVALRALTWTFLFHALHSSEAWSNPPFRSRFLRSLYLHGEFTERNLEWSDVNGNHYTADAAGLVFIGLFFGEGAGPQRWQAHGWEILRDELPRQVLSDGVDFEASTAYHRLVAELFLLPALYRRAIGLDVPDAYRERLLAMAAFTDAALRPNGTVPHWGDEDDARALPLGGQALDDHRYLPASIRLVFGEDTERFYGPAAELLWLYGSNALRRLRAGADGTRPEEPAAFPDGGVYVLRGEHDHVFVDCGPVGLAGRGGHGHNDITSIDATLDGVPLLLDPGTFTYTASPEWRNRFRSTAFHNAVQVDGEELNRFGPPDHLWNLHDDARPVEPHVTAAGTEQAFRGGHTGYRRLADPVDVTRTVRLDVEHHRLLVVDTIDARGAHELSVRFTLPPGASLELAETSGTILVGERSFDVRWLGWRGSAGLGWVSPSYGIKHEAPTLELRASSHDGPLAVAFAPAGDAAGVEAWLQGAGTAR